MFAFATAIQTEATPEPHSVWVALLCIRPSFLVVSFCYQAITLINLQVCRRHHVHLCGLVAVMMVVLFLTHGHHAAVSDFALHVFELDRSVVDAEAVLQALLHVPQDALAD